MSDFLYYLPDAPTATRETCAKAGLAYALAEGEPKWSLCPRGPDGAAGVIFFARSGAAESPAFDPAGQTWRKCGPCWMAWRTADPPGPETLARGGTMDGHPVRLGDGRDWVVPVARRFPAGTGLPQRFDLDEAGAWTMQVFAHHRGLFDRVGPLAEAFYAAALAGSKAAELSVTDELELCADALAVHYRVGRREVAALGLLTTDTLGPIVAALIDLPGFQRIAAELAEASKKNGGPPAAGA